MTDVMDRRPGAGGGTGGATAAPSPDRRRGPWLGCLGLLLVALLVVGGAVAGLAALVSGFRWPSTAISFDRAASCRNSYEGLTRAAVAGDVARVRAALVRHPDLNATDAQGDTPLSCAVLGGSASIVRLLLAAGADPDRPGSSTYPCFSFVELSGTRAAADCRLPIAQAVDLKRADLVVLLAAHGADPTAALLEASVTNDVDLARVALDHGADPNGGGGTTPLVYDVAFSNEDLVALLLARGADPNRGGPADASQVLVHLGQVRPGRDAGDLALGRLVCDLHGTAPNLPPVVVAAAVGDPVSTRALLADHADPNATASYDRPVSAALAAQVGGESAVASVLREAGARPPASTTTTSGVARFGC